MKQIRIKRPLNTMVQPRIFERDGQVAAAGYTVWVGDEEVVRIEYTGPSQDVVITVYDGELEGGLGIVLEPIGTEGSNL